CSLILVLRIGFDDIGGVRPLRLPDWSRDKGELQDEIVNHINQCFPDNKASGSDPGEHLRTAVHHYRATRCDYVYALYAVLIEQTCPFVRCAGWANPFTLHLDTGGLAMAQRSSFAEMKAEQARMTESWKAEGRTSEAWAVADPEIVEIFTAGVAFGVK